MYRYMYMSASDSY